MTSNQNCAYVMYPISMYNGLVQCHYNIYIVADYSMVNVAWLTPRVSFRNLIRLFGVDE